MGITLKPLLLEAVRKLPIKGQIQLFINIFFSSVCSAENSATGKI
jgi:hypothetical protein